MRTITYMSYCHRWTAVTVNATKMKKHIKRSGKKRSRNGKMTKCRLKLLTDQKKSFRMPWKVEQKMIVRLKTIETIETLPKTTECTHVKNQTLTLTLERKKRLRQLIEVRTFLEEDGNGTL